MNNSRNQNDKAKKSLLTAKRSPVAWNRLNLKVISSESKDILFGKIAKAVNTGAILGRDIIAGANSVTRLLERDRAAVIAVCRDSSHSITDHIVEAAKLRKVPIVILPRCVQELATLLNLKRISCFAISIELDDETISAEIKSRKNSELGPKRKSKKRKLDQCGTALNSGSGNQAPLLACNDNEISVDYAQISDVEGLSVSVRVEEKICEEGGLSEEEIAVRSDSEVAAALVLPACMDDLRDAMISMTELY